VEVASVAASKEELEATQASLQGLSHSVERLKTAKAEGRIVLRLAPLPEFKGGPYDVELMGGDALLIPQASSAVSVVGEVYNPTTFLAMKGKDVDYYVQKAGGLSKSAQKDEIYVLRADGSLQSRQQRSFDGEGENWFQRKWFSDPFMGLKLDAGDTVVVPKKLEKIAWMREIKDITQILSQMAVVAGVVIAAGL
jgi:protein involved in polysaccharide export with SLBB domain